MVVTHSAIALDSLQLVKTCLSAARQREIEYERGRKHREIRQEMVSRDPVQSMNPFHVLGTFQAICRNHQNAGLMNPKKTTLHGVPQARY
jgi:hypothetical protein